MTWKARLEEARTALVSAVDSHAFSMSAWVDGDEVGREAANLKLRTAVQVYENILSERTGALLDLERIEESREAAGLPEPSSTVSSPTSKRVSVLSRYDYQLDPGEDLEAFNPVDKPFVAGIQILLVPDHPLPTENDDNWPPDDLGAWMDPRGELIHEDVFVPLDD